MHYEEPELSSKQELLENIISLVEQEENPYNQIEILANVCLHLGTKNIFEATTDPKKTIAIVLEDIKTNGNTIANSLAMQGITILEWLSRIDEDLK